MTLWVQFATIQETQREAQRAHYSKSDAIKTEEGVIVVEEKKLCLIKPRWIIQVNIDSTTSHV